MTLIVPSTNLYMFLLGCLFFFFGFGYSVHIVFDFCDPKPHILIRRYEVFSFLLSFRIYSHILFRCLLNGKSSENSYIYLYAFPVLLKQSAFSADFGFPIARSCPVFRDSEYIQQTHQTSKYLEPAYFLTVHSSLVTNLWLHMSSWI